MQTIEKFYYVVKPVLFESRLLDSFRAVNVGDVWYLKNQHGAEDFWHSYLVYRVQHEIDSRIGRFTEIRRMAQDICKETDMDMLAAIDGLCWLALEKITEWCGHTSQDNVSRSCRERCRAMSLLSAAAYFNLSSLAKALLLDQHCLDDDEGGLFPPAMQVAAWRGHFEMLELFQRHMPEITVYPTPENHWKWSGRVGLSPIIGAAICADMAMLRLAFYPPSRENPKSSDFAGQPYGTIEDTSPIGGKLRNAQLHTKSPEVYTYIEGFLAQPSQVQSSSVIRHAEWGNVAMVKFLLDRGGDMIASNETALVAAASRCQEEVIDLLLERGADPNYDGKNNMLLEHLAIEMAASTGSLKIVQKLLAHGAHAHEFPKTYFRCPPLFWAFATEHTGMINLLLENGATLQDRYGNVTLAMAECCGLDTMVKMLRELEAPPHEDGSDFNVNNISTWGPWSLWRTFGQPYLSCGMESRLQS